MRRSIPIIAFVMVLFLVLPCYGAEECKRGIEGIIFGDFREIKYFDSISVYVNLDSRHKTTSRLRSDELTDFLKRKYKNTFASFPFKKPPKPHYLLNAKEKKECGQINVTIMTTGDEYPIAYYVEINAGNLSDNKAFDNGRLGYCNKAELAETIKSAMANLLRDFAITFFKVRGET